MAAIPPLHEDPPTGTGSAAVPPEQQTQRRPGETGQAGPPSPQPGPDPAADSQLPRDWSPATPSDGDQNLPG